MVCVAERGSCEQRWPSYRRRVQAAAHAAAVAEQLLLVLPLALLCLFERLGAGDRMRERVSLWAARVICLHLPEACGAGHALAVSVGVDGLEAALRLRQGLFVQSHVTGKPGRL